MVNPEVFGGLVSALSRGESLQKAMMTLFNAGYSKKEIEESAMLLNSRTPTEIMQTIVHQEKELTAKKETEAKGDKKALKNVRIKKIFKGKEPEKQQPSVQKIEYPLIKKSQVKQVVSKYGNESPREFKKIVSEAIRNLSNPNPPIEITKSGLGITPSKKTQHISDYSFEKSTTNSGQKVTEKKKKFLIILLIILIAIIFGFIISIFFFKEKFLEIINNFGL